MSTSPIDSFLNEHDINKLSMLEGKELSDALNVFKNIVERDYSDNNISSVKAPYRFLIRAQISELLNKISPENDITFTVDNEGIKYNKINLGLDNYLASFSNPDSGKHMIIIIDFLKKVSLESENTLKLLNTADKEILKEIKILKKSEQVTFGNSEEPLKKFKTSLMRLQASIMLYRIKVIIDVSAKCGEEVKTTIGPETLLVSEEPSKTRPALDLEKLLNALSEKFDVLSNHMNTQMNNPNKTIIPEIQIQSGKTIKQSHVGGHSSQYKSKYLKYKTKYINLKNSVQ